MEILNELRSRSGLTLRQVEDATGISNAYLSQLENGKIKKPSAQTLYVLSKLYGIGYEEILIASGLIKDVDVKPVTMDVSIENRIKVLEQQVIEIKKILSNNQFFNPETMFH